MASSARLDELKKKFDENPRRYFAPLANEHRKSGDLDQAIALCRTHLPQQPAHISGHIVLAQALFEAGSLDESREIFHTALGLDPENLIALRYLGDIARDSEDIATARGWYQRVLEVDPRNDEIVQLISALDAPRAAVEEQAPVADAKNHNVEPPVAAPAPLARAIEDNPRFAPLSLENVDFDEPSASSAGDTADVGEQSGERKDDTSFDVGHTWNADVPTVELPTLDEPELDPFELDPSAGVESLVDADEERPSVDALMAELSDVSSLDHPSHVDPEYSVADAWAPAAESKPADAAPAEPAEAAAFEEGAFYIEPPPEQPAAPLAAAESVKAEEATVDASTAETAAWELPDAPAPESAWESSVEDTQTTSATYASAAPETERSAAPEPGGEFDGQLDLAETSAHAEPNAEAEAVASAPTAEWETPAPHDAAHVDASANDALGLEFMEFVPPARGAYVSSDSEMASDPDSILGRTPELASSGSTDQAATPPAFVTETMAELYLQQGFRNEALAVYRELLARNPNDSSLRDRIDQIESGSMSSIADASVSAGVVESALRRQSAKPARSVRSFFGALASRRAPYRAKHVEGEGAEADVSAFAPVDSPSGESSSRAAPESSDAASEPAPAAMPSAGGPGAPMMSAADVLASFDPFADALGMPSSVPTDPMDASPNVTPAAPASSMPEPPARRSLEDLFPDSPVTPRAEAAAQTLATAFGRQEPQGRPTRAASSELSLDKVFRGAPEGAPAADGGFSFDQFFSDARPAGGDVAAPTMSPPEAGRSGGSAGEPHDIEQFTAWLEGLKKK